MGVGRITWVVGLSLVVVGGVLAGIELPAQYRPVTDVLAELLAIVGLALGWRFRRSRLALAAVTLGLANFLLRGPLAGAEPVPAATVVLGLLLPLNLCALALVRDAPLPRAGPLVHLAVVGLQPLVGVVVLGELARGDQVARRMAAVVRLVQAPEATLLVLLMAGVVVAVALLVRRGAFEAGLLMVLVPVGLVVVGSAAPARTTVLLAVAQAVMLVALVDDLYRLAFCDQLTGLPSRRALDETLRTLDGRYALAMADVDHFKRFNDRWGHEAGDQVLRMVAEELRRVGSGGRAFRYGGEEFAVVFPGRSAAEVVPALEAMREAVAERRFTIRAADRPQRKPKRPSRSATAGRQVRITLSAGVCGSGGRWSTTDEVLKGADKALYRAKSRGRNRVVKA